MLGAGVKTIMLGMTNGGSMTIIEGNEGENGLTSKQGKTIGGTFTIFEISGGVGTKNVGSVGNAGIGMLKAVGGVVV